MKRVYCLLLIPLFFVGCKSTPQPVTEEPESVPEIETEEVTAVEEIQVEPEPVEEVITVEEPEDNEEYLRSINDLSDEDFVTKDEFSEDKKQILQIIEELKDIMEREDTKEWLTYLDPASITYYSSPANIRKAQKKLPDKTIQLHGIGDYFKYVFIPSRKRSQVDEIRYISKTNVKAVQVKDDNNIVIYYYFVKIDGQWLIHIPEL